MNALTCVYAVDHQYVKKVIRPNNDSDKSKRLAFGRKWKLVLPLKSCSASPKVEYQASRD